MPGRLRAKNPEAFLRLLTTAVDLTAKPSAAASNFALFLQREAGLMIHEGHQCPGVSGSVRPGTPSAPTRFRCYGKKMSSTKLCEETSMPDGVELQKL